jgi:hypothetical protein
VRKEEIRDCFRAQVAAVGMSEEAVVDTVEGAVMREVWRQRLGAG